MHNISPVYEQSVYIRHSIAALALNSHHYIPGMNITKATYEILYIR